VSRVLDQPGQKLTRIEICKKNLTQPESVMCRIELPIPTHFDSSICEHCSIQSISIIYYLLLY